MGTTEALASFITTFDGTKIPEAVRAIAVRSLVNWLRLRRRSSSRLTERDERHAPFYRCATGKCHWSKRTRRRAQCRLV